MITNIFIPEKIGSNYILPKRVVGFSIGKTHIHATKLHFSGTIITLEKCLDIPIDTNTERPYSERVQEALISCKKELQPFDDIRSSLSSSLAIFKELTLPFSNAEEIAMVIDYEIEQFLPFPASDAVIDFIVTKKNSDAGQTTIFASAVQKQHIAEHIALFDNTGINPNTITIDLFDLYGLYTNIPSYNDNPNAISVLDIGLHTTKILYIVSGTLCFVRTLPQGLVHIAKNTSKVLNTPQSKILENIIRFGTKGHENTEFNNASEKAVETFFEKIKFTLQSFENQTTSEAKLSQLLLLGEGAEVHKLDQFISDFFKIPCNLFDINKFLKLPTTQLKKDSHLEQTHVISIAATLKTSTTDTFNLRKGEFASSASPLFNKQFIAMIGLIIVLFGLLLGNTFLQNKSLKNQISNMEREVVKELRDLDLIEKFNFQEAIMEAEERVEKEEELWFGFSRQTRFSFLQFLQNLSIKIDRKSTNLDLQKLIITSNEITFEGNVKEFDDLKVLERELRKSELFVYVPTLQELKFSEKLVLKKTGESTS